MIIFLERIVSIETMTIKQVACGLDFTLAVNDKGKVLSWGNNCHGQLAHPTLEIIHRPRYFFCQILYFADCKGITYCWVEIYPTLYRSIKHFNDICVTQVSCGMHHSMALTFGKLL